MTAPLPELGSPARRFIDDMAAAGAPVTVDGARLRYEVLAVAGVLAGQRVPTAVSLLEVQNWPLVPPHWVHLPATITFPQTNCDMNDCAPGWQRHSREFALTDMTVPPATSWLRHVRGLLSVTIAQAA